MAKRTYFQRPKNSREGCQPSFVPGSLRATEAALRRLHVPQHLLLNRRVLDTVRIPHSRQGLQQPAVHALPQRLFHLLNLANEAAALGARTITAMSGMAITPACA